VTPNANHQWVAGGKKKFKRHPEETAMKGGGATFETHRDQGTNYLNGEKAPSGDGGEKEEKITNGKSGEVSKHAPKGRGGGVLHGK